MLKLEKNVNNVLVKLVASLECQLWRMHSTCKRSEHISVVHSDLEKTVCKVLQHIGPDICDKKIESCQRHNKKAIGR